MGQERSGSCADNYTITHVGLASCSTPTDGKAPASHAAIVRHVGLTVMRVARETAGRMDGTLRGRRRRGVGCHSAGFTAVLPGALNPHCLA